MRWIAATSFLALTASAEVGYNRDVRPILSDRCFKCHGFDAKTRKADLRLDVREAALEVIESGELMNRLTTSDPEEVMPPPKDHAPLKPKEIALLKQWIAEGAKYEAHWAFGIPESRILIPDSVNPVDFIVHRALLEQGLKPAPRADDATLRRRVALALTGLPPSSFDIQHSSFESLVDSLLSSPHFGERLAIDWLDAARYADTHGFYTDAERQAWPWRDWVIRAFNDNMPFDRFTIEQLAGDLLPDATLDQKIATAFNRNHTVTNETGIIDEEYRVSYVADRVETTAATWLGLTMGCAKCHDHKFDPLTMRDYYALFAAFNNLDEKGIIKDVAAPVIELPTEAQTRQIADLAAKRQKLESGLKSARPALDSEIAVWELRALQSVPASPSKGESAYFSFDSDHLDHGPKALKASVTGKTTLKPGVKGGATMLNATQYVDFADPWPLERDRAFTLSVWINPGSSPQGCVASKQDSDSQARGFEILWYKSQPRINLAHRYGNDGIEVVAKDKFSGGQWRHLVITYDGSSKAAGLNVYVDGKLSEVDVRRDSLSGSIASKEPWRIGWKGTGIGFEGGMDEFRLFDRGQYDQPADTVTFAVPASLGQLDEKMPRNRLGLAQWLLSKKNPLTARVMVNRLWTMCFGDGLVRTPNDFGLQGEAPINAELLDFLAVRFRDGDAHTKPWDVKALLKLIVTSETFQQSSRFTPELLSRDPDNRLLARGPRFRLPAEVIRDQALALSGLLVPKIGGPSVKPPQPAGLWEAVSYNGEASYLADKGDAAHRRGLYTFWKRQSPPPDMLTLDGPTREVCTVRRPRTNTPLQALLLLNDENYLEAAKALAQLILREKDHRIEWAFHRVTGRHANAREINALCAFFNAQRAASSETQAWTMLASLLLNLDEVQTLH